MTTNWYSTNEISLSCVLFTMHARVAGTLKSNHYTLNDALNSTEQTYALVLSASVRALTPEVNEELFSTSVILRKEHVVFGVPETTHDIDTSVSVATRQAERGPQPAMLKAGPYILTGQLYVIRGSRLMDLLLQADSFYLPMLDVTVSHDHDVFAPFTVPYLLINRQCIDAVLEDPQPRTVEADAAVADAPPPTQIAVMHAPVDEVRAAEILLATEVFRDAEIETLQAVLRDQLASGGIARMLYREGTVVVQQDAEGDDLYVVERGSLEVLLDGSVRPLAMLHTGDVFGEMGLLGDRHRTATVRVSQDASLLMLTANCWRVLASQLPRATTNLLKIMTARRGGRGGGSLLSRLG